MHRIPACVRNAALAAVGMLLSACSSADAPTTPTNLERAASADAGNQRPTGSITLPASGATFVAGAPIQFSGDGSDPEDGALNGTLLVWTSNRDGRIGTGRSFTRTALSVGTHVITLSALDKQGASYAVSRTITVNDSSSAPPPVTPPESTPGTTPVPNPVPTPSSAEPAGMTLIDNRPFNCVTATLCESNWATSLTYPTGLQMGVDATAPKSAPNVAVQWFLPGLDGGSSPATTELTFMGASSRRTLYVAAWMKLSSNFQGHPTATNKIIHLCIDGMNKVFLEARGIGNGVLLPAVGLQGLDAPFTALDESGHSVTATSHNLPANLASTSIVRGQWQKYEIVVVGNNPGVADGAIDLWLDGVHVMSYVGLQFVGAGNSGNWNAVQWSPTWGGLGGTILAPFSLSIDEMYISGK